AYMKLEKFIQKDMVKFLDQLVEEHETPGNVREEEIDAFTITKDYPKEVQGILEQGNLHQAREVFIELNNLFNTLPPGGINQEKAYDMLFEMQQQIASFLSQSREKTQVETDMEEMDVVLPPKPQKTLTEQATIDKMSDSIKERCDQIRSSVESGDRQAANDIYQETLQLLEQIPDSYAVDKESAYHEISEAYELLKKPLPPEQVQEGAESQADETSPVEDEVKEEVIERVEQGVREEVSEEVKEKEGEEETSIGQKEIVAKLDEVRDLVRQKKAREALDEYKNLKEIFTEMEAPREAKEDIFVDILAVYKSINELEEYMEQRKQRPPPEPAIKELPEYIEQLQNDKLKAYKYLDKSELRSAVLQYNKLKDNFHAMSDEHGDEKVRLYRELLDLHDRITAMEIEKRAQMHEKSGKAVECWETAEKINNMIKDDIEEAGALFLGLQHQVIKMPDDQEKKDLYRELDAIQSRIQLIASAQSFKSRLVMADV
ncbi:hypothetical protein ACFL1B_06510, partial [Nanoarchaeota archaeon]